MVKKLLERFTKRNSKIQIKQLELHSSNNAKKSDLKNARGVDASNFAKNVDWT